MNKVSDILLTNLNESDPNKRETALNLLWENMDSMTVSHKKKLAVYSVNNMFDNIGSTCKYAIKRTFNSLLLSAVLENNLKSNFLSSESLIVLKNIIDQFCLYESPSTGYSDNGWIHNVAHICDVYYYLVKNNVIQNISELHTLFLFVFNDEVYLNYNEQYRLINVIQTLNNPNYRYLENFIPKDYSLIGWEIDEELHKKHINFQNFMLTLNYYVPNNDDIKNILHKVMEKL